MGSVLEIGRKLCGKFFYNLYSPAVLEKPFGIDWSPIFPREDEELVAPFTIEEIRNVFQL